MTMCETTFKEISMMFGFFIGICFLVAMLFDIHEDSFPILHRYRFFFYVLGFCCMLSWTVGAIRGEKISDEYRKNCESEQHRQ